jgi:hypothetical protein
LSAILTYDTMAVSSHGPIFSFLGKLFSRKPAAVDTVELRESKWPSGNKDAKGSAKLPSFSSGNGGREKSGATGAPPDSYLGQSRRATHGHFDPTRTSHHPTTTTLPALAESGLEPAFEPTRTYSQYAYPPDLEQERQRERQQTETMLSTHSGREMHALAESQLDPTATVDMSFLDPHNGYYASPYAYGTHSQSQSQVDQFDELDRDRLSPRPRGQEPRPPQRLSSPPTPIAEERGKENPLVPEHFAW